MSSCKCITAKLLLLITRNNNQLKLTDHMRLIKFEYVTFRLIITQPSKNSSYRQDTVLLIASCISPFYLFSLTRSRATWGCNMEEKKDRENKKDLPDLLSLDNRSSIWRSVGLRCSLGENIPPLCLSCFPLWWSSSFGKGATRSHEPPSRKLLFLDTVPIGILHLLSSAVFSVTLMNLSVSNNALPSFTHWCLQEKEANEAEI